LNLLFPGDPRALRRRDRVLAILFALFLAVLVARAARKDGGVLLTNQGFGARFLAGEDPYFDPALGRRVHAPYPPSFALAAAPLSLLPTTIARVAWAGAQATALVLVCFLARGWASRYWPRAAAHAPVLFAIALLLASRFVLRDTAGGGGNGITMALAMLGLDLVLRGRELAGGLPIALSLVLKPNLAPLLLWFGATSRWKSLASTAVCSAVLFLLPALSYGWDRYLSLAERWGGDAWSLAGGGGLVPEAESTMNQNLRQAVGRLVPPPAADWISGATVIVLTVAAIVGARRAGRGSILAALAFLPLCLLLSPITWKAHHAALLPLFFALACVARTRGRWSGLSTFLLVYWLVCGLASEEIVGRDLRGRLQALSVVTWGDVALLLVSLRLSLQDTLSNGTPARSG